jgi:hypothetical protein
MTLMCLKRESFEKPKQIVKENSIIENLDSTKNRNDKSEVIPAQLSAYIKAKMPTKEISLAPNHICSSDFDGNGNMDYVVVLKEKESASTVFTFNYSGTEYSNYLIKTIDRSVVDEDIQVVVLKKGLWNSATESKNSQLDGFSIDLLNESITVSYFWNGNDYEKFLWD